MRLDHLLSKRREYGLGRCSVIEGDLDNEITGVDALRGHTRSHPEHDG